MTKALTIANTKPNSKTRLEKWAKGLLFSSAAFSVAITFMILGSVLFESVHFFSQIPLTDFLFGTKWSPHNSIEASFGAVPVFLGTILITLIAMSIATPLGLYSAIYLSEYSSGTFRDKIKPILEVLAGIPTVVYGYFAVTSIAPSIRNIGGSIGLDIASESALAAGVVMGIMIIPFILSLSDDVINSAPDSLREASLALGSTRGEMITQVLIPAAFPGIISAVLLGISRAIGETMIVVMAAGLAAKLTANPLESVTTVTVQIVTLLTGDQEFDSPRTLAAFALGISLFITTFLLNIIALKIAKKYKERYA